MPKWPETQGRAPVLMRTGLLHAALGAAACAHSQTTLPAQGANAAPCHVWDPEAHVGGSDSAEKHTGVRAWTPVGLLHDRKKETRKQRHVLEGREPYAPSRGNGWLPMPCPGVHVARGL